MKVPINSSSAPESCDSSAEVIGPFSTIYLNRLRSIAIRAHADRVGFWTVSSLNAFMKSSMNLNETNIIS